MLTIARHESTLKCEGTGLLVIDMQEKFRPSIAEFDEIAGNVVRLVQGFLVHQRPLIVTEQYPRGLGVTVEQIRSTLPADQKVIEKIDFSSVRNEDVWSQIRSKEITTFVVCGIEAHVCVNQTVHDLLANGIRVHLVLDAIGSRKKSDCDTAVKKMISAGAVISTTEMSLFEMTGKAGTDTFKEISRIIK